VYKLLLALSRFVNFMQLRSCLQIPCTAASLPKRRSFLGTSQESTNPGLKGGNIAPFRRCQQMEKEAVADIGCHDPMMLAFWMQGRTYHAKGPLLGQM